MVAHSGAYVCLSVLSTVSYHIVINMERGRKGTRTYVRYTYTSRASIDYIMNSLGVVTPPDTGVLLFGGVGIQHRMADGTRWWEAQGERNTGIVIELN